MRLDVAHGAMTAATGLGPVETAILEALDAAGAGAENPQVKSSRILETLYEQSGIPPRIGYQMICELSRPWAVHLPLVDFHGNYGSLDFEAAAAQYTECRLSAVGDAALAAERGEIGALPIALVNGDVYVGGRRPPLDPARVDAALRAAARDASADELVEILGVPQFPTRCRVDGDLRIFASGEETTLRLSAEIDLARQRVIRISRLPPDVSTSRVAGAIARLAERDHHERIPLADVDDASFGLDGDADIWCTLEEGADPHAVAEVLRRVWGITTTMDVELGLPLPQILRNWVREHAGDDLDARLDALGLRSAG